MCWEPGPWAVPARAPTSCSVGLGIGRSGLLDLLLALLWPFPASLSHGQDSPKFSWVRSRL